MKEDIIYLLFDNWCNSGHEPEVIEGHEKSYSESYRRYNFLNFLLQ